jgi:hypothetical protein
MMTVDGLFGAGDAVGGTTSVNAVSQALARYNLETLCHQRFRYDPLCKSLMAYKLQLYDHHMGLHKLKILEEDLEKVGAEDIHQLFLKPSSKVHILDKCILASCPVHIEECISCHKCIYLSFLHFNILITN